MIWNDGSQYKGDWYGGIQQGFGRMLFANGETKEGYFENGIFKVEGSEQEIREMMSKMSQASSNKSKQS
jgi:hypothetical protein